MEKFRIEISDQSLNGILLRSPNARGIIIFIHGLGEHIGRYHRLFSYFSEQGFTCLGTDHSGHGLSPGKKGDIANFSNFHDEIDGLVKLAREENSAIPIFLYGHSLGGNIVLNYLVNRDESELAGVISASPWIRLPYKIPVYKRFMARCMNRIYPAYTESNSLDPSGISRETAEVERYSNDPLIHDRISVRLFRSAEKSAGEILKSHHLIHGPVLLMHGTGDSFTNHKATMELSELLGAKARLNLFPGMKHELHHEINREYVLNIISEWLNSVLLNTGRG